MRPTRRGIAILVSAIALYGAGEAFGFPLFRVLAGAALGMLVAGMVAAARRPTVDVSRELYPNRVECGRAALAVLRVRNPGHRRHPGFTAGDLLDGGRHVVTVRELPPGATTSMRYQLPTERRGRLTVGPLTLERTDPLGLVRNRLVVGDTAPLWVHPRRHPVRTVQVGWPRHHHEGASPEPLSGATDLRQIREYVVGDEIRHLHWKAMARTGRLMVREYADPAQPRFTVLLDNRIGVLTAAEFEEAVEVAASLTFAAITAGHRTRLRSLCGTLDLHTTAGLTGAAEFLDHLAELAQSPAAGIPVDNPGGAVVLVSGGTAVTDRRLVGAPHCTVVDLHPTQYVPAGVRLIRATTAAAAIRSWNSA